MISLIGVADAEQLIAKHMQQQRVSLGLTQADLAARSGVNLSTLRKFEQKGQISLLSLLKIALVLQLLDKIVAALQPNNTPFLTIDDVIAAKNKRMRKRGRHK